MSSTTGQIIFRSRLTIFIQSRASLVQVCQSSIRYVRHPLDGKDIRSHLAAGKYPTRMGLTWNGRVSFVLTDKLCLKRIEFLEVGKDQTDTEEVDPAEQFDIDFAVMAGELSALLKDLARIIESPQASENPAAQSKVA
jgi:recombination associated protein RdgC